MELGFLFVSMCVVFAILQSVQTVVSERSIRRARRSKVGWLLGAPPFGSARVRLQWADAEEFSRIIASDSELAVFRLIDGDSMQNHSPHHPGYLSVTLNELKETLPWIPHSSRIAVYHSGGLDARKVRRLSVVLRGRDVLLLQGAASSISGNLQTMAGELCN